MLLCVLHHGYSSVDYTYKENKSDGVVWVQSCLGEASVSSPSQTKTILEEAPHFFTMSENLKLAILISDWLKTIYSRTSI